MSDSFAGYYKRLFRVFKHELWATWRTEAWPSVLLALATYLLTRKSDQNAWHTLVYAAFAAGLYWVAWGIYHLIRTPWKLDGEERPTPAPTLTQTMRSLSIAVLDFAYERSEHAPKILTFPDHCSDGGTLLRDMRQHGRETLALQAYEEDTRGIYEYRFRPQVDAAVSQAGLADSNDWKVALNTSGWQRPYSETIKAIGRGLKQIVETTSKDV